MRLGRIIVVALFELNLRAGSGIDHLLPTPQIFIVYANQTSSNKKRKEKKRKEKKRGLLKFYVSINLMNVPYENLHPVVKNNLNRERGNNSEKNSKEEKKNTRICRVFKTNEKRRAVFYKLILCLFTRSLANEFLKGRKEKMKNKYNKLYCFQVSSLLLSIIVSRRKKSAYSQVVAQYYAITTILKSISLVMNFINSNSWACMVVVGRFGSILTLKPLYTRNDGWGVSTGCYE